MPITTATMRCRLDRRQGSEKVARRELLAPLLELLSRASHQSVRSATLAPINQPLIVHLIGNYAMDDFRMKIVLLGPAHTFAASVLTRSTTTSIWSRWWGVGGRFH